MSDQALAATGAPSGSLGALLPGPPIAGADVDWRTQSAPISKGSQLKFSIAQPPSAGGRPLRLPGLAPTGDVYEVQVQHDWPVRFETKHLGVDVSPHAGVGMAGAAGVAEAGASVQVSQKRDAMAVERLKAMGVRDGSTLDGKGRWYLFAAASGRAVGMNMMHSDQGWNREGWTTDPTSTLVGDAQVGVGWRKGAMQTSVGFVHREIKGEHLLYGVDSKADSLVALSFSVRPH